MSAWAGSRNVKLRFGALGVRLHASRIDCGEPGNGSQTPSSCRSISRLNFGGALLGEGARRDNCASAQMRMSRELWEQDKEIGEAATCTLAVPIGVPLTSRNSASSSIVERHGRSSGVTPMSPSIGLAAAQREPPGRVLTPRRKQASPGCFGWHDGTPSKGDSSRGKVPARTCRSKYTRTEGGAVDTSCQASAVRAKQTKTRPQNRI